MEWLQNEVVLAKSFQDKLIFWALVAKQTNSPKEEQYWKDLYIVYSLRRVLEFQLTVGTLTNEVVNSALKRLREYYHLLNLPDATFVDLGGKDCDSGGVTYPPSCRADGIYVEHIGHICVIISDEMTTEGGTEEITTGEETTDGTPETTSELEITTGEETTEVTTEETTEEDQPTLWVEFYNHICAMVIYPIMAGTSTDTCRAYGTLKSNGNIYGVSTDTATATGILSAKLALIGDTTDTCSTEGILSNRLFILGDTTDTCTVSGTLSYRLPIVGDTTDTCTVEGTLIFKNHISGTTTDTCTVEGTINKVCDPSMDLITANFNPSNLVGETTDTCTTEGILNRFVITLSGITTDTCTVVGALNGRKGMSGETIDTCTTVGVLSKKIKMYGVSIDTCTTVGTLTALYQAIPCVKYGLLYNWFAATDIRNISSTDSFRLPTYQELGTFITFLNSNCLLLKDTGTLYWNTGNGLNSYNFTARGSGRRSQADGSFLDLKNLFEMWSSTTYIYDSTHAHTLYFGDPNTFVARDDETKTKGVSIRLMNPSTTLLEGEEGVYIGNDSKIYRTICINGIEWMADNLQETKFRNGETIPFHGTNNNFNFLNSEWIALTTAGVTAYDNDPENVGCDFSFSEGDPIILTYNACADYEPYFQP